jgi:hypothetical protein
MIAERVRILVKPEAMEEQLFEIHNVVTQKLDECVIALNGRVKSDHDLVQVLEFACTHGE